MNENLNTIESFWARLKKEPKRTVCYTVNVLVTLIIGWVGKAYLLEIGKQLAPQGQHEERLNQILRYLKMV